MIPVLSTASSLLSSEPKALEHGSLLLERVIIALAAAETVLEIVVVLVIGIRLFGMNVALGIGFAIDAQGAWTGRWDARRSAIAGEVSLLEDLDKSVLAMAGDGARVAHARRSPTVSSFGRRRVAGQTGKDVLS